MAKWMLRNVQLVLPGRTLPLGYVAVDGDRLEAVGEGEPPEALRAFESVDGEGGILAPGFIDLHVHGGGGCDFMDGTLEAIVTAARAHLAHGTTTLAPTTLACSDEELFRFFGHYERALEVENMPRLAGIHLEGPYFSKNQAGAQLPAYLRTPEPKHYHAILERGHGHIIRWSLAPELDGALALGDLLKEKGILASIGHSDADYKTVCRAMAHGFTHITHFYSGMSSLTRREGFRVLGVVECGYLFDQLHTEIIADGMHLPPELLRLILKQRPHEQISLVTDAMRGAGMPEGPSILGSREHGLPVVVQGGIARMLDLSGFAGSVATTDRLVRTMVCMAGLALHEAVAMMTLHPARLLGREAELGSLEPGKKADLVLLDTQLYARRVWVGGTEMKSTKEA